jgi:hypothetical protein
MLAGGYSKVELEAFHVYADPAQMLLRVGLSAIKWRTLSCDPGSIRKKVLKALLG